MENRSEKTYIEKTALLDFFGGIIEKLSPYEIGPDGRWVGGDEKRYRWTKEIMDGIEKLPGVVQPELQPNCYNLATDSRLVSLQAAIDAVKHAWAKGLEPTQFIEDLPSVQPEITLESAIDYLHSIGWMQEHDRILSSAQPEIIHCKDCKWGDWYTSADGKRYCYCMETGNGGRTENDYCSHAERRTDEQRRVEKNT